MLYKLKKRFSFVSEDFRSDIHNVDTLSTENVDFVYQTCKEYLANTLKGLKILETKVVLILCFIFAANSFLIATLLEKRALQEITAFDANISTFLLCIIVVYLIVATVLIVFAMYPCDHAIIGNEPKNLIFQTNLNQSIKTLKLNEAEDYQRRIDCNLFLSEKLAFLVRISLLAMILSVLFFGVVIFCFGN
ncbi:hypothetical protein [Candidatus Enterovibrio escicola]|uniref:hypothetical protein n=1 Tax=Candidatus Enterovibrio escicola TaxID=1927127 RepID=UPI0012380EAD